MQVAYCSEFHSELAIDCSGELIDHAFLITLDLTKEGLKHINTVS